MDHVHLLSGANGTPRSKIMFIGEAPGRLGAARTGVPFTADQSGVRFQRLLDAAGLRREDMFITNALLCNPLLRGTNRSPRRSEIANCAGWLRAQLDIVTPRLVVTLGARALEAVRLVGAHDYELRRDVGKLLPWCGRTLVPLYHPSPRTAAHRSFAQQMEDFRCVGKMVRADAHC